MNNSFDFSSPFLASATFECIELNKFECIFAIHDISTLAMNDIFVFVREFKDLIIFNGNL